MDSDYLAPRFTAFSWNLQLGSDLLLYCSGFVRATGFLYVFQGLIRTSFHCSYFYTSIVEFLSTHRGSCDK